MEAKVIGTQVTKFFCVDKLVWSPERGKIQKSSLNSYQNAGRTHIQISDYQD